MTGNKEVITGNDYKRMIAGAYSAFLLEYENINALNGESLLDRKAGTHILRTIGAAAMSLRDLQAESIGGVSKRVGSAAILGARGNAGVFSPSTTFNIFLLISSCEISMVFCPNLLCNSFAIVDFFSNAN